MPIYDLSGDFVADDVKFGDTATTSVERDAPPSQSEAEALLRPVAEQSLETFRGGVYPYQFVSVKNNRAKTEPVTDDTESKKHFLKGCNHAR